MRDRVRYRLNKHTCMKKTPVPCEHCNGTGTVEIYTGDTLRARRHELGLSLTEMADEIGYNRATIHQMETGANKPNKAVIEFLGGTPDPEKIKVVDPRRKKTDQVSKTKEYAFDYRHSPEAKKVHMYNGMRQRVRANRSYQGMEILTREAFEDWMREQDAVFCGLYKAWKASGFQHNLSPTVDRIDSTKGYTPDNMRLMSWRDNLLADNKRVPRKRRASSQLTNQK